MPLNFPKKMEEIKCCFCGDDVRKHQKVGKINQRLKEGRNLYCNMVCAGMARRKNRTAEEKKMIKSDYDKKYRAKNEGLIKARSHDYFKKTYNPEKASIKRKESMHLHIEYCRQPKYVEYKKEYDKKYRAKKVFGEFWESAILINEIQSQYDDKEVRQSNNLHNKSQKRKRQWKTNTI